MAPDWRDGVRRGAAAALDASSSTGRSLVRRIGPATAPRLSWKRLRVAPWRWTWRRPQPKLWVSWRPNGIGLTKPHHYREMWRTVLANRHDLPGAWRILTRGVCDGCALGVAGLHDWTLDGVHLCTTRLRLLELNTARPLDPSVLGDAAALARMDPADLRGLGRLGVPLRRRAGEAGFSEITWDEALDVVAGGITDAGPDRVAAYLTSRGLTNETYYAAAKAWRAMGVRSIDSAARTCHSPSTIGLKATLGVAASTCSLADVLETDLMIIWGSNPANNQPVLTKYLDLAKRQGTKIVVVNPYLEPGLDRYWVPSNVESAIFGTRLCDLHVPVRPGGDVALAMLVLAHLVDHDAVDRLWLEAHTTGWAALEAQLATADLDDLRRRAGVGADQVAAFAEMYAASGSAIVMWSMGITQRDDAVEAVRALVDVALARGNVGRDGAGLMPIRGHSGVQGGAEMGAYATALPGGLTPDAGNAAAMSQMWGFDVPIGSGLTAPEMALAAGAGELDVLFCSGGNLLDVLADPTQVRRGLERVALRVHADIVMSPQMLVDGGDVIVLPVATRYEQSGGGTSTTTERRVAFSPEIRRPPASARSEWQLYGDLAARVRPELVDAVTWPSNQALRAEIARVVPEYAGIETLERTGDQVQVGGRHLCAGGVFPTPDGRAQVSTLDPAGVELADGQVLVTTRRGKQFNTMVWDAVDPLTGAGRDAVYLDRDDAAALGIGDGDRVVLDSAHGSYQGRAHLVRLAHRSAQVHWPEGNVVLGAGPEHLEPRSKVPDYRAVATVRLAEAPLDLPAVGVPTLSA